MYNPGVREEAELASYPSWFDRLGRALRAYATPSNLVGLVGGLLALVCFLALPMDTLWNIRLPLYLMIIVWTLLRPRVAIYLLPIAIPWGSLDQVNLGGLRMSSGDILVFMLAASWLMSFVLRPSTFRYAGPLDRDGINMPRYIIYAMLFLLLTMLLSMTVTVSIVASIKEMIKWIEVLIILVLASQYVRTRRQLWTLIVIACLAALSQAFFGYAQAFLNLGPSSFIRDAGLRVYGTFDQPNPYAGYINITLSIALALTLLGHNWRIRILAGSATILLAIATYLTKSKGGNIAIGAAVFFILMVGLPRARLLLSLGLIGSLGVIAAYLAGFIPESRVTPLLAKAGLIDISFTAPSAANYANSERLAHWLAGINMFQDHPLFGVGIGSYAISYPQYTLGIFIIPLGHAHNYYINISAEAGIFGLSALVLFLTLSFIAGTRSLRRISQSYQQLKQQLSKPQKALPTWKHTKLRSALATLANDRALAVGLLAALLSLCVHNFVDNLYVHGMTNLFALLLVLLIRLERVNLNVGSDGGRFDYR